MQRMLFTRSLTIFFISLITAVSLFGVMNTKMNVAHAENNGLAATPFMGWSTWSYVGKKPTAANVYTQAQVVASKLKASGYNYVLLDDFYYLNPSTTVDANGYWVTNTSTFPGGLAALATKVHALGLKFGAYVTPGVPVAAVKNKSKIIGTNFTADQIATTSKFEINYNYGNQVMYYIDYSKPGAQAYINGWAKLLASWGIDFLKIDGVGSFDIPDVLAWDTALLQSGRAIVYDLSNTLNINDISTWRVHANAWRISGDVQCYCSSGLVTWQSFSSRFSLAPQWVQYAGSHGWNDLDSINLSDGSLDGITNDERQTYMTLWSIEAAPLYAGDDLTRMDSYGLSLLTNSEVIAVDQAQNLSFPLYAQSKIMYLRIHYAVSLALTNLLCFLRPQFQLR